MATEGLSIPIHSSFENSKAHGSGSLSYFSTSPTILIVEDSAVEGELLKLKLSKFGYRTVVVKNGCQAISYLLESQNTATQPDIVVSDWHMPEMDGITLCKKVKKELTNAPYFMILTSRTELEDLVAAMDCGADDFLRKPFSTEELRVRVQAGLRVVSATAEAQIKNIELSRSLQKEKELHREMITGLKAAAKLQISTLPPQNVNINGLAMAHYFKPAQGVAGDTYSMFEIENNIIGFYQVDVAGHGIRSAMLSYAISRYLVEITSRYTCGDRDVDMTDPAAVVTHLNEEFASGNDCTDYFTMVYGIVNCTNSEAVYCQPGTLILTR